MRANIPVAFLIALFALCSVVLSPSPGEAQCVSTGTATGGGVNSMTVQKNAHFTSTPAGGVACNVSMSMGVANCANGGTWLGAPMVSGNVNALFALGSGNPTGTCQVVCGLCAGGCMSSGDIVTSTLCVISANASDGLPVELMEFSVE